MIQIREKIPFNELTIGTLIEFHTQSFFNYPPIAAGYIEMILIDSHYLIVNDGEIDFLIEPDDYIRNLLES